MEAIAAVLAFGCRHDGVVEHERRLMLSVSEERAIRRNERHNIARLARAHVADGDLLALQRFIRDHGDVAAQRGLALFVGFLTSFGDELTDEAAA